MTKTLLIKGNETKVVTKEEALIEALGENGCIVLNNAKAMKRVHKCNRLKSSRSSSRNKGCNIHILDEIEPNYFLVEFDTHEQIGSIVTPVVDLDIMVQTVDHIEYETATYLCHISDTDILKLGKMKLQEGLEDYQAPFAEIDCGSTPPDFCGIEKSDVLKAQLRGSSVAYLTADCTRVDDNIRMEKRKFGHPPSAKFSIEQSQCDTVNRCDKRLIVGSSTYCAYMSSLDHSKNLLSNKSITFENYESINGLSFMTTLGNDLTDIILKNLIGEELLTMAKSELTHGKFGDSVLVMN